MAIRVLVAEKSPSIRRKWRVLLAREVDLLLISEATTGSEMFYLCEQLRPDVLVLAWSLLGNLPIEEALGCLREASPATRVLLSASDFDRIPLQAALVSGAAGCLLHFETPEAMALAVRTLACGAAWFSQAAVVGILRSEAPEPSPSEGKRLTRREHEVLQLLAVGLPNKVIARRLELAERTVEFHVTNILRKLALASRLEAVIWAKDHGLSAL